MKHILLGAVAFASVVSSCTNNSVNPEITQNEIKESIAFLASDSLKGRKPGTPEGKVAADYIASQFEKAGLQKLGDSFFQQFKVVTKVNEGKNNIFSIGDFSAKVGEDYRPLAFSHNAKVDADVVFAGYGIEFENDTLKWNDYKNIDVKGKWVMMLRQDPDINNSDSPLIAQSTERAKALLATDKGALGVLFVSGVNTEKKDILDDLYFDKSKSRADIPVIQITRKLADKILENNKVEIEKLESKIISDFKTNSFVVNNSISAEADVIFEKVNTQNIIAKIEGSDPELKDEIIIIGAHYDHLGFGGPGSGSRTPDTIAIHNGADDNASGVAGIIQIAQKMANADKKPKRTVIFMSFGAEEMGLLGSKFFTENPLIDIKQIKMMLNFDMIGRLDSAKTLTIGGTGTTAISEEIINRYATKYNFNIQMSKEGSGPSDHAAFYVKNIPVLFFFTGIHDDYHTPADDVEKINFDGEKSVAELGYSIAEDFANMEVAPKFIMVDVPSSKSSRRKLKVTFGIIPNYAGGDERGMRIDGVRTGGPAQMGGMQKGDVIVAIDGKKVANIYDYMARLGRLKKGERCNVDVFRGDKKVVLILDL